MNPEQVFHSTNLLRQRIDVILVHPEEPGNVGSVARAIENMGLKGDLHIVGPQGSINSQSYRLAKHAGERLNKAVFSATLGEALDKLPPGSLSLASTARVGSPQRPHPLWVNDAIPRAIEELRSDDVKHLVLVFGPEGSGLQNEDVALCNWVVTIPSDAGYRSLNLAQAVLVFAYEIHRALLEKPVPVVDSTLPSQRGRLIAHFLELAEAVGFILPGDPMKMGPRLHEILSQLPPHIEGVQTLHGFLSQAVRSVEHGERVFTGRYRHIVEKSQARGLEESPSRTYNEAQEEGSP